MLFFFFFFNDTATTEIYTLSLHDALPICGTAPPAPYVPPDPETIEVTRRQFFNRSIVVMFALGLAGFGAASLAFLWPQLRDGFGSALKVGLIPDLLAEIRANNGFLYRAEGRLWLTEYPNGATEKAAAVYSDAERVAIREVVNHCVDAQALPLVQLTWPKSETDAPSEPSELCPVIHGHDDGRRQ